MRVALDTQQVPVVLRRALYVLLVGAGVVSVPFVGSYGPLPTTAMLDAWIIVLTCTMVVRGRTRMVVAVIALAAYLISRVVPAALTQAPLEDFLQAYRWVFYLIVLAMAVGRKWGRPRGLARVTWILLCLALVKAVATVVIIGPGERPGLLLENNFELALFAGLIAVVYRELGNARLIAVALLAVLTVLSGSRSGAVVFLVLAFYAITQLRDVNLLFKYVIALLIPVLVWIPINVFTSRVSQGVTVDRIRFLDVFLGEASQWNVLTWLFGTMPITPLSNGGCARLSFYENLFSSVGDGRCYSVILHSFLLRVLFDAGLIGLIISIAVPFFLMRISRVNGWLTSTLILISIANGASVSGLNNPYVALPMILATLLSYLHDQDMNGIQNGDALASSRSLGSSRAERGRSAYRPTGC